MQDTYCVAGVKDEIATPWNPALRTAAEDSTARAIRVPMGIASVAGLSMFRMRSPANRTALHDVSARTVARVRNTNFIRKSTKKSSQVCGPGKSVMKHRRGWSRRNLSASCVRDCFGKALYRHQL